MLRFRPHHPGTPSKSEAQRFGRDGSTLIEFGIISLVLLLFVLGIIDTGRLIWTYATLARAADAAARCGAVNTNICATASQIQQDAVNEAWGLTVTQSAFTVTKPTCGVQVSAAYTFQFFTPGLTTVTLSPSACYPL